MLVAIGLIVSLIAVGCGRRGKGAPAATQGAQTAAATPVSVVIAKRGTIQEELELTGTCNPTDESDVVSEASGKVVAVHKDVGDLVRAGEPLVQLDTALVSKQRVQAERLHAPHR
jgi:multidrug efflux system membrane fusion protein